MNYNYKEAKKRINVILNDRTPIQKVSEFPDEESADFSFKNGILSWVGAIFIDIVNASELFKEEKQDKVARIMRAFSSELVELLHDKDIKVKQVGLRGDAVYGIYSTPYKQNLVDLFDKAAMINTMLGMFNQLLIQNNFPEIKAGIGIGAGEDLIIKAGKPRIMNDLIWIGSSVVDASNLSSLANRDGIGSIAMSETVYDNIIEILVKQNKSYKNWIKFNKKSTYSSNPSFYHCDVIFTDFNEWVKNGMK